MVNQVKFQEIKKVFVKVFKDELQMDDFSFQKDVFIYVDYTNHWLKYITLGSIAGGRFFRNCIQIKPFTYTIDLPNSHEEFLYDFLQLQNAQNGSDYPHLFSSFNIQDTEESIYKSLQIYRSFIRPLQKNIHSFSDSVYCAEHLNALCHIGEYNEWQSILSHAYLGNYQYIGTLFDKWQSKKEQTFQAGLKEREEILCRKDNESLLSSIDIRLQECQKSIQHVKELYCRYQKHDLGFFVNKADEQICETEKYVKRFLLLE